MKKLLIISLIAFTAVTGANAADNSEATAKLKSLCSKSSEKIWIEKDGICAPINPCTNSKYARYCENMFSDIKVSDPQKGAALVSLFTAKFYQNSGCASTVDSSDDQGSFIGCTMKNGDYLAFSFSDLNDADSKNYERNKKACNIMNGYIVNTDDQVECSGISEEECEIIEKQEIPAKYDAERKVCTIG